MKGHILEWNDGKGYKRGLLVKEKEIKSLTKQGRAMVYMLDEDGNIKLENGKKLIGLVTLSKTKIVGFKD